MSEAWDELARAAVIGTERQPFAAPDALGALAEVLEKLAKQPSEPALLSAAGAVWLYAHAGALEKIGEGERIAPAEAEELAAVSPAAADRLARILGGEQAGVLPEWLGACAAAKKRVVDRLLPDLLEAGRKDRALRALVGRVIGARGRWLIGQRQEWSYTSGGGKVEDPAVFETGAAAARAAFIVRLRESDSARARELVASVWETEPPENRQTFLGAFREGLSMADEPFLEAALDDKRKEVRKTAADLLARLPESRFMQRMIARVEGLLTYTPAAQGGGKKGKGAKIDVALPEEADKSMVRDGIDAKPGGGAKMGQKAYWLSQMIAVIHPGHWLRAWKTTPQELIDSTNLGDWKSAIVDGWAGAAARHGDAGWAAALLAAWSEARIGFDSDRPDLVQALMAALPSGEAESIVTRMLQNPKRSAEERFIGVVTSLSHQFSQPFARTLLGFLREQAKSQDTVAWHMRESLKKLALQIPPGLAEEAASGWPTNSQHWDWWEGAIDNLVATLQFRQAMLKEINS